MSTLTSKALLNKLHNYKTKDKDGFTLIELLIVVIIVGVLSSVALPAFIGQAAKAKISAAKALASTAAKECQTYLVGDQLDPFKLTTKGGGEIVFPDTKTITLEAAAGESSAKTATGADTCTLTAGGTFVASIPKGEDKFDVFSATVVENTGGVIKICSIANAGAADEVKDGCTLEAAGTEGTW